MDIITYILAKKYTDKVVKDCGGHVVDATLSETSENPVQNKTITKKIKEIISKLITDKTLKISDAFADSKVVGDKFSSTDKEISSLKSKTDTTNNTVSQLKAIVDDVDAWKNSTENRITQLEGTGKVLPAVTSADAGKYLRVNADGEWEVATVNKLGDIKQKYYLGDALRHLL